MSSRPVLAIVGPTAGGKSAVALALAERALGELVSCDSVQVYRGFDIGCAKPTRAERERVPHHLLDVVDPTEPFDAARYRDRARAAIADIEARARLPIVCGGTGLYLRALRFGLIEAPPPDLELRERLYREEAERPGAIFARLSKLDPEAARVIDPRNLVRLVRAIEVTALAGVRVSELRARHGFTREQVPMRVIALDWPTPVLRARIEARVDEMLARGLCDEVARLLEAGVSPDARPMRAVGYKETCDVVRGRAAHAGLSARITRATFAYARRQRTWLKRERGVAWRLMTSVEQVVEELYRELV